MKYVQASKSLLIDTERWAFVGVPNRTKPANIDVPFYLWSYPESSKHFEVFDVHEKPCVFSMTSQVRLNELTVKFHQAHNKACVQFQDGNRWHKISLKSSLWSKWDPKNGNLPSGVNYKIAVGDEEKEYRSTFLTFEEACLRFWPLSGMDIRHPLGNEIDNFCLGIPERKFEIMYKGKLLSGQRRVLLCGHWGILLSDDFKFDTMVLFSGVDSTRITIDSIVYTVNCKDVKASVLWR